MNTMFYVWLVVAFVFLTLELGSPGLFYFLSFSFGAALSGVTSLYINSITGQALLFLAGSIVAMGILRRFVRTHEHRNKKPHTNMYALQGKRGVVLIAIEPNKFGQVKIGGEQWAARAHNNEHIEAGCEIEVVSVGGAHVIVKSIAQ